MYRVYKDSPYREDGSPKPVVFLQHGLADSCDSWIINFKEKAPAYVAAEAGYDIWLGNNRGNKYSQQHVKWDSTEDHEYWVYSFAELGKYDLPAFIKHV